MKLHQSKDPDADPEKEAERLRGALEREKGVSLQVIGENGLDLSCVKGKNCENVIGAAQIPMGVAGPVALNAFGSERTEDVYVPLATTEGTLVASVNRGCRASYANGVATSFELIGTTRAPVFSVKDAAHGKRLLHWLQTNKERMRATMREEEPHIDLLSLEAWQTGRNVYVRFACHCGEAMGMNMTTIAVQRVVKELIEPETGATCVALSGNMCSDKKPAAVSYMLGRGRTVHAEAVVSREDVERILKTTPEAIVETWTRKTMVGSVRAGVLGANAHAANVLAALYIAAGQDPAHVVDASSAITTAEIDGEDLVFGVTIPSVMVGAVGGGTGLPTQREALDLMGIDRPEGRDGSMQTDKLAQIVGAAVLAGELSLHAALAASHLAKAHQKYGRSAKREKRIVA